MRRPARADSHSSIASQSSISSGRSISAGGTAHLVKLLERRLQDVGVA